MSKKEIIQKCFSWSLVVMALLSVLSYIHAALGFFIINTFMLWGLQIFILVFFFKASYRFVDSSHYKLMIFVSLYLGWNVLSFIRGCFITETYWDTKALLTNGFALLLPVVSYSATNTRLFQFMMFNYLKHTYVVFIFLMLILNPGTYGFYLVPVSFLALFLPVLEKKWKYIVLVVCLFVALLDLGARSTTIKFILPILFSLLYYYRRLISTVILEIIRNVLFLLPFVLFALAVSGQFNIFNISSYVEGDYSTQKVNERGEVESGEDLTVDTRSPLYLEVLNTAKKHNTWVWGRSPARGNETELFAALSDITGREERISNEVAILNIFTWTGLMGVLLYFLVFYKVTYLAINKSNNIFCKILGLYLTFRWCYAWVEDINNFTITYCFLWLIIGLCFSKKFRSMDNKEVILWVNGMLEKKYWIGYNLYENKFK